jgi:hypothetical protein
MVNVDLPLPEGPMKRAPAPVAGSTTPPPCNSKSPQRLSADDVALKTRRARAVVVRDSAASRIHTSTSDGSREETRMSEP